MALSFRVVTVSALVLAILAANLGSLVQLFDRAFLSAEESLTVMSTEAILRVVERLEAVFNESSATIRALAVATTRYQPVSAFPAGSAARARQTRLWLGLMQRYGLPEVSNLSLVNIRWAADSASYANIRVPGLAKAQLCAVTPGLEIFPPGVSRDPHGKGENCTIVAYETAELKDLDAATSAWKRAPWPSGLRTGFKGVLWNEAERREFAGNASNGGAGDVLAVVANGFWVNDELFFFDNGAGVVGFTQQFVLMTWDVSALPARPLAMISGRVMVSSFGDTLREMLPTSESRAFMLDSANRVLSYSHGSTFVNRNFSGVPFQNCAVFEGRMGCLRNVSTDPEFAALRRALAMPRGDGGHFHPHGRVRDDVHIDEQLLSLDTPNKWYAVARLDTAAVIDGAVMELSEDDQFLGIYNVFRAPLLNDFDDMEFTAIIFVRRDIIMKPVYDARKLSIGVVVVLSVLGAVAGYFLVGVATRRVEDLAQRMAEDPWRAELDTSHLAELAQQRSRRSSAAPSDATTLRHVQAPGARVAAAADAAAPGISSTAGPSTDAGNDSDSEAVVSSGASSGGGSYVALFLERCCYCFANPSELAELEAEFAAFRTAIAQLRGFMLLPMSLSSKQLLTAGSSLADDDHVRGSTTRAAAAAALMTSDGSAALRLSERRAAALDGADRMLRSSNDGKHMGSVHHRAAAFDDDDADNTSHPARDEGDGAAGGAEDDSSMNSHHRRGADASKKKSVRFAPAASVRVVEAEEVLAVSPAAPGAHVFAIGSSSRPSSTSSDGSSGSDADAASADPPSSNALHEQSAVAMSATVPMTVAEMEARRALQRSRYPQAATAASSRRPKMCFVAAIHIYVLHDIGAPHMIQQLARSDDDDGSDENGAGTVDALCNSSKNRRESVRSTSSSRGSSGSGSGQNSPAAQGDEAVALRRRVPKDTAAAEGPNAERARMRKAFAIAVQRSKIIVEALHRVAVSVGATIVEFHGDHFLVAVQVRNPSVSKIPTRFVQRLIELSTQLAIRFHLDRNFEITCTRPTTTTAPPPSSPSPAAAPVAPQQMPRQPPQHHRVAARTEHEERMRFLVQRLPSRKRIQFSCGLAVGRARLVMPSATGSSNSIVVGASPSAAAASDAHSASSATSSSGNSGSHRGSLLLRPATFFGDVFGTAVDIERQALRDVERLSRLRIKENGSATSSAALSPSSSADLIGASAPAADAGSGGKKSAPPVRKTDLLPESPDAEVPKFGSPADSQLLSATAAHAIGFLSDQRDQFESVQGVNVGVLPARRGGADATTASPGAADAAARPDPWLNITGARERSYIIVRLLDTLRLADLKKVLTAQQQQQQNPAPSPAESPTSPEERGGQSAPAPTTAPQFGATPSAGQR